MKHKTLTILEKCCKHPTTKMCYQHFLEKCPSAEISGCSTILNPISSTAPALTEPWCHLSTYCEIMWLVTSAVYMNFNTVWYCAEYHAYWFTWHHDAVSLLWHVSLIATKVCHLTHCGREDLWKWAIFYTILTSPKSWLSQEDLDAGCEHSLVPMDS